MNCNEWIEDYKNQVTFFVRRWWSSDGGNLESKRQSFRICRSCSNKLFAEFPCLRPKDIDDVEDRHACRWASPCRDDNFACYTNGTVKKREDD